MITRLTFIRHGQSTWNEARRWQGHADPPLSDNGRRQAQLLARRLATWPIDHIYASDLMRASETAAILGTPLGIQPTIDPDWRERGFGALEGLTSEEIEARYPEVWASRLNGPIMGVSGAEEHANVAARAVAACDRLLSRHPGETIAVVSHGGMILTTLVQLLRLPPSGHALLSVGGNTSISQVVVEHGYARLTRLNDTGHLEFSER